MSDPVGGRIRRSIEANGFRRLAAELDELAGRDPNANGWPKNTIAPLWLSPFVTHTARRMLVALLRAEADRLDPKEA